MNIINQFAKDKVIAIIRNFNYDDSFFAMDCLIEAGFTNFEISLNTEDAVSMIKDAKIKFGSSATIGAGTVMTVDEVDQVVKAGAEFIFAPNFNEDVVARAIHHKVLVAPGVFTPTEMQKATELGCPLVKLFPASTLGPSYVKQVLSPLTSVNIMAVGGIDHGNMDQFILAGALCVGVGSSMMPEDLVNSRDKNGLLEHLKKYKY